MKVNKIKFVTSTALTLMIIGTPLVKSSAMESNNVTNPEYKKEIEEFQKEYGKENEFKISYEDNEIKEEVNGATGEIKTTDKKTGKVEISNYFKDIEEDFRFLNMSEEEQKKYLKEEFQKEYGKENEFKMSYEDDEIKEEVNGATGEIKITDKKTGKVESFNYFKDIEEFKPIEAIEYNK